MEEFFGVLVACVDAGDIDLLPFNGDIVGFEYRLDSFSDFSSNAVT